MPSRRLTTRYDTSRNQVRFFLIIAVERSLNHLYSPVSFQTTPEDPIIKRVDTVGRVHPHVKAKVVDKEGNTVPVGIPGELLVSGYLIQKGYDMCVCSALTLNMSTVADTGKMRSRQGMRSRRALSVGTTRPCGCTAAMRPSWTRMDTSAVRSPHPYRSTTFRLPPLNLSRRPNQGEYAP